MEHYEDNGALRWLIAGTMSAVVMMLFLVFAINTFRDGPLPDLGPLHELDFVVVEEPRIEPVREPPRVQPRRESPPESTSEPPQSEPVETAPLEMIETEPVTTGPADIPAAPALVVAPVKNSEPHRIGSPAELDNVGFEPLFNPKPDYPPAALEARITGYVDVDLVINADGKVKSFTFANIKGHPAFGKAVAEVLPRWRFPPPRIGGKKTSVKYVYRINFALN